MSPWWCPHFGVSGIPSTLTAGTAETVTVTAYNANNTVNTTYNGTIHFSSDDPRAILPADAMLTNGVGSFQVTLITAGLRSVTVTDTVNGSLMGNASGISVTPGDLASFSISGLPHQFTEVGQLSLQAVALDSYGNVATGYDGSPTFSTNTGYSTSFTFQNGLAQLFFDPGDSGTNDYLDLAVTLADGSVSKTIDGRVYTTPSYAGISSTGLSVQYFNTRGELPDQYPIQGLHTGEVAVGSVLDPFNQKIYVIGLNTTTKAIQLYSMTIVPNGNLPNGDGNFAVNATAIGSPVMVGNTTRAQIDLTFNPEDGGSGSLRLLPVNLRRPEPHQWQRGGSELLGDRYPEPRRTFLYPRWDRFRARFRRE